MIGQDPLSINYTIKNGLPSNTVYGIKMDSKGYLWITTDKGVVKYDGRKFKLFTIHDGLASNDNFSMLIDSKDNVWLYSFKAISKIDSKNKIEIFGETNSYFNFFGMNSKDEIFYTHKKEIYIDSMKVILGSLSIIKNNKHYVIEDAISKYSNPKVYSSISYFYKDEFNIIYYYGRSGQVANRFVFDRSNFKIVGSNDDLLFNSRNFVNQNPEIVSINDSIRVVFGMGEYLIIINGNELLHKRYPNGENKYVIGVINWFNDELLVILDQNIYSFSVDQASNVRWMSFLKKPKATGLVKDNEGNIWVSTLGNGLLKYVNISGFDGIGKSVRVPVNDVFTIAGYKDKRIWVANQGNNVIELIGGKLYSVGPQIDLRFLECDDKSVFLGGSNALFINSHIVGKLGFKNISLYKDSLAAVSTHGIYFLKKNDPKFKKGLIPQTSNNIKGRMYAVLLSKNIFYSGNQQGLYWGHPKKDELIPICLDENIESVSVNGIRESSNGLIWVSTEGNGVYILKNKVPIRHIDKELLDGNILSMRIDNNDNVWLSTSRGLNKISLNNGNFLVKSYTTYHGLPSNYIHDTYCYNDELYIATDEGLVKMDVKELDKLDVSIAPPVYIQSAMVVEPSRKILNIDSTGLLRFNKNSIHFEYTGISYRSNGNISFEYRLIPAITSWQTTRNDNIAFTDLRPDHYKFEVRAINSIGTKSDKPAEYSFTIEKHFTQKLWFILASLATGIFLISFIVIQIAKYRRGQIIAQNETERMIAELKLKSLQAQMNPHFIFNSLNAIQGFINGKNEKAANDYLVRFAQLIRLYLTSSESKFITLKQEMKVVEVYIELEYLRFSDKFQYKVDIASSINMDGYTIPAMLIQPHVENAIRHGLIPSGNNHNNLLEVSVLSIKGGVQCIVKDNGIGRQRSHQIKGAAAKEHLSLGSKITRERLDAIKELNLSNITQRVSDIIVDGNVCGTIVEITILDTP